MFPKIPILRGSAPWQVGAWAEMEFDVFICISHLGSPPGVGPVWDVTLGMPLPAPVTSLAFPLVPPTFFCCLWWLLASPSSYCSPHLGL